MAIVINKTIHFGTFVVNPQIFCITPLSFALVNLKPILPGHVLVSPQRVVPRLSDLSSAEVQDLFNTVQRVSRMIERVFGASALNIAIQDGKAAGQSVPHLHAHILPRRAADMDDRGGSDAIYDLLEGEEGDIGKHMRDGYKTLKPDASAERKPRDADDMTREAAWLAAEMEKEA